MKRTDHVLNERRKSSQPSQLRLNSLFAALVILFSGHFAYARERYSSSSEYQEMIRELHQAAPSPAFIATGRRPEMNPSLHLR